ncbi:MAG: T9SS type A sorting domain-containing protein [Flavobacteriales bacterium]|nr:T9SS type A sorting domain-containing protein [Flavobacteriales bacterium]
MKHKKQLIILIVLFGFITSLYSQTTSLISVDKLASVTVDGGAEIFVNGGIENQGTMEIGPRGQVSSQTLSNETSEEEGDFNIKSDATGTGSLITNAGSNAFVNMERYVGYDNFGEVSSPTESTAQVLFDNGTFVQRHEESKRAGGLQYIDLKPGDFLNAMEGYSVDIIEAAKTLNFSGIINSGVKTFTLTSTDYTGSGDYFGWNLVGNPYTSAVVWSSIVSFIEDDNNKVNRTIYILDGHTQAWLTYNPSLSAAGNPEIDTIPAGQGFFVQLLSTEGNDTQYELSMNNFNRIHNNDNVNFGTPKSRVLHPTYPSYYLELIVTSETNSVDRSFYHWREDATNEFDSEFDSYKMIAWTADIPNVYFYSGTTITSIQQEPETETVKVGFSGGSATNFEFSVDNVQTFTSITLEDKQESTMTDLMIQSYPFTKGNDDNNRFILHLSKETLSDKKVNEKSYRLYSSEKSIIFVSPKGLENAEMKIFDSLGRCVKTTTLRQGENNQEVKTDLNMGIYIVKISSQAYNTSKTLLIK